MMNSHRFIAVTLLSLILSLGLTACGGESPSAGLGASTAAQSDGADALSLSEAWLGDLNGMLDRRLIRVLTVYGPGRYYLADGAKGMTAEYAKRLEEAVNKANPNGHLKTSVVVIPVARDQLFPALQSGRGDIVMAGTTITERRQQDVDFTNPVRKPLREVLVTGPSAGKITRLEDLAGKTVYVRASSSYADSLGRLSQTLQDSGKAPITVQAMSELLEDEDIIEMVNAGLLPWAVVDSYKPKMWKGVFDNIVVRDDLVLREGALVGWAVRKNSPKLKRFLNEILAESAEGTLFGNILRNRYERDFDWASNALAEDEISRYRKLRDYFRQYGEAYGVDPALLAAQGFQESRLDQSVRSKAGAVGVMQLLPATAKDKNVGITNIHRVEPNIEAGAKYLAFLRDRYFSNDNYDRLNSDLMALAAYNAGPNKIRKLQETAQQRGYNPNRWFDNVEVIAAEVIGSETVKYVSNIYKYYLSYEMVNRQTALRDAARKDAGI